MIHRIFLIAALGVLGSGLGMGQELTLSLSGIRNEEGVLRIALFTSQEDFSKENATYVRFIDKSLVNDGRVLVKLEGIPPGHYGIAVLDDENDNGTMDYRFMIPREGCGFSNYFHTGFSRPRFEDFEFEFRSDLRVEVRMKYYQ